VPDYHQRLQLLEAVQKGELMVTPVFPLPQRSNKFAVLAYDKLIGRKGMRKYWLATRDFSVVVTVPAVDFRTFIHATLALVPKDKETKMLNPASSDEGRQDSVEAHESAPLELKTDQGQLVLGSE